MNAQRRLLPRTAAMPADGPERWHFQHGPIDLVLVAEGEPDAVAAAQADAWQRFQPLLAELVSELPRLRQPLQPGVPTGLRGLVAQCMAQAAAPLAGGVPGAPGIYITPMVAVAGAVAQTLIQACMRPGIRRAWVNNGGDIALHLAPGQSVQVGLVADLAALHGPRAARTVAGQATADGHFVVHAHDPVRGIATSGWRGRSHSRGVADSVTVLAATAAQADAAATAVANAVDLPGHAGIGRQPANTLRDDSDLGDIPVTVSVPDFTPAQRQQALQAGLGVARALQAAGLLHSAALVCQGSLASLPAMAALQSHATTVGSVIAKRSQRLKASATP